MEIIQTHAIPHIAGLGKGLEGVARSQVTFQEARGLTKAARETNHFLYRIDVRNEHLFFLRRAYFERFEDCALAHVLYFDSIDFYGA